MTYQSITSSINEQLSELKLITGIQCIAFSIRPLDPLFIDIQEFSDSLFLQFVREKHDALYFCLNPSIQSIFHEENFLMIDFFNTFVDYKRNKFQYFYEQFFK